jgi:hypothetical protein
MVLFVDEEGEKTGMTSSESTSAGKGISLKRRCSNDSHGKNNTRIPAALLEACIPGSFNFYCVS